MESITRKAGHLEQSWGTLDEVWEGLRGWVWMAFLYGLSSLLTTPALLQPVKPWVMCGWAVWALYILIWSPLSSATIRAYHATTTGQWDQPQAYTHPFVVILALAILPVLFFIIFIAEQGVAWSRVIPSYESLTTSLRESQQQPQCGPPPPPQGPGTITTITKKSSTGLSAADLAKWPRRQLERAAVRTGMCSANANTSTMVDALVTYSREGGSL